MKHKDHPKSGMKPNMPAAHTHMTPAEHEKAMKPPAKPPAPKPRRR